MKATMEQPSNDTGGLLDSRESVGAGAKASWTRVGVQFGAGSVHPRLVLAIAQRARAFTDNLPCCSCIRQQLAQFEAYGRRLCEANCSSAPMPDMRQHSLGRTPALSQARSLIGCLTFAPLLVAPGKQRPRSVPKWNVPPCAVS